MNKKIIILILIVITIFFAIYLDKKDIYNNKVNNLFKINIKKNTEINKNIPKDIYLSYKDKNIPDYIISNWKKLNPDYNVYFYDNNDCINFLQKEFGSEYVDIFNYIKDGPIKADYWRCCILYKYGGVYSDFDVMPLIPINQFLEKDVTFLTCTSVLFKTLNPQFIMCTQNHPILKKAVDTYLYMYRIKYTYTYVSWSVVHIFTHIINDIFKRRITEDGVYYDNNNNKYQFLKEVNPNNIIDTTKKILFEKNLGNLGLNDVYCKYKDKIVLYNKYSEYDVYNHKFKKH